MRPERAGRVSVGRAHRATRDRYLFALTDVGILRRRPQSLALGTWAERCAEWCACLVVVVATGAAAGTGAGVFITLALQEREHGALHCTGL